MKKIPLICFSLLLSFNSMFGQETFKTMFYNVLNYPLQLPTSRIQDLAIILDDYRPDIFMVCELNNEQGANDILGVMTNINPNYARANFVLNTSDDDFGNSNELQNMIFYDSSKFNLEFQNEVTTIYRDFNHYLFKLNTENQDTNPIFLNVFVCHLKSSSGTTNQNLRKQMVDAFISYLDTNVPSNSYVILGGDLNLYTSSEPAFQELIDPSNSITFEDPANMIGSWSNNTNYLKVFTQSTRTQSGLGGATGGFDDRFDFILTSESLNNNTELAYVNNSYQVYGNNNNINCYNSEINSSDCSGNTYSLEIRESLYYMSDHLPVTLELQTSANLLNNKTFTKSSDLEFISGNVVFNTLSLKSNTLNSSLMLFIFNSLGQRIQTIAMSTSILHHDVSYLPKGVYYVSSNTNVIPIKFIKK